MIFPLGGEGIRSMKIRRSFCVLSAVLICTTLGLGRANASVLIDSWENSIEGWGVAGSPAWTSTGFVTSPGVTDQTYSWQLTAGQGPNYSFALGGTASTAITSLLSIPGQIISIDVLCPAGSFSYQQWTLTTNNNAGALGGYASIDGYSFSQSPVIGNESTLSWTISAAQAAAFAAVPASTTSINFQIGGGLGAGSPVMYLDNLRASVPEPASVALLGFGGLSLIGMAIRRRSRS